MKLENFQRVASFLRAQGIEPKLDMLSLEPKEWRKLLDLAKQWEASVNKMHRQPELTPEEIEDENKREAALDLYWSAS